MGNLDARNTKLMLHNKDYYEGRIFHSSCDGDIVVIEYKNNCHVLCEFINTKNRYVFYLRQLLKGNCKDRLAPKIYGVGYIGVGNYKTTKHRVAYDVWHDMLRRCYYEPDQKAANVRYIGCRVSEEWFNFQVFADWFYANCFTTNMPRIDKDILGSKTKVYSPQTCCIVPHIINTAVIYETSSNTSGAVGVTMCGDNNFHAQISKYGKKIDLGRFDNIDDAKNHYCQEKKRYLMELAESYKSEILPSVYEALNNYCL